MISLESYEASSGLKNLLKCLSEIHIHKFIFASSSSVYGIPTYFGVDENHTTHPITLQGKLKLQQENAIIQYSQEHNNDYAILRLSNVYGKRQGHSNEPHLFYEVLDCIHNGSPLIIEDDGLLMRDYIYINDVVNALVQTMDYGNRALLNIGSGVPVTSRKVVEVLEKHYECKIQVESIPLVYNHVNQIYLDIKKSINTLKWHPEYTLHQGIVEMTCPDV